MTKCESNSKREEFKCLKITFGAFGHFFGIIWKLSLWNLEILCEIDTFVTLHAIHSENINVTVYCLSAFALTWWLTCDSRSKTQRDIFKREKRMFFNWNQCWNDKDLIKKNANCFNALHLIHTMLSLINSFKC